MLLCSKISDNFALSNYFMSANKPLRDVLRRFAKARISGVMAGDPAGQISAVDKGKTSMIGSSQQTRKSPHNKQQDEE